MNKQINDPVNHPSHYTDGKFEVIDIIEEKLGMDGLRGFCLGNCMKYMSRSGKKDVNKTLQDLEKGAWYLNHYIKRVKVVEDKQLQEDLKNE